MKISDMSTRKLKRFYFKMLRLAWKYGLYGAGDWVHSSEGLMRATEAVGRYTAKAGAAKAELIHRGWKVV